MKVKEKPCKAMGKAKASDIQGCGESVLKRTYGLCQGCYAQWLLNTPEGKEKLNRSTLIAKGSQEKQKAKDWSKEKSKRNIDLMSKDKYRATYIQPLVNHLARIIDNGQPCICTKLFDGKMNGGHRHSTGSNPTLTLSLHNIHNQSFQSNHHQSGDHLKYRAGLKRIYGIDYADFIDETLMQCPPLHLTKDDLIELKPRLQKMVNYYKKLNKVYTILERLKLRNKLNTELGIYPEEYAVFTKLNT